MKKNYILFFVLVTSFLLFLGSLPALAQSEVCRGGIVPCGRSCDVPGTNADESQRCTLCHLIIGIWTLIDYGFKIMVFVGLVMIVIGGVIYIVSAGSEQMITTAKNIIKYALGGFALVLAAWLIVYVVMTYFGVKQDLGIEATRWNEFRCSTTVR